jgi:uroporphyrinogen decarboxylase
MGGMDRHGVLATGTPEQASRAATEALKQAPTPFVLGADCTLPGDTNWDNIRAAVGAAHRFSRENGK